MIYCSVLENRHLKYEPFIHWFISKALDVLEVRALCSTVSFLHTSFFLDLALYTDGLHAETEMGLTQL